MVATENLKLVEKFKNYYLQYNLNKLINCFGVFNFLKRFK